MSSSNSVTANEPMMSIDHMDVSSDGEKTPVVQEYSYVEQRLQYDEYSAADLDAFNALQLKLALLEAEMKEARKQEALSAQFGEVDEEEWLNRLVMAAGAVDEENNWVLELCKAHSEELELPLSSGFYDFSTSD